MGRRSEILPAPALAAAMLLVGCGCAAVDAPTLVESFQSIPDGGLPDGWRASGGGSWRVSGGALRGDAGDRPATIHFGDSRPGDVGLEVAFSFDAGAGSAGWLALLVRDGVAETRPVRFLVRRDAKSRNALELSVADRRQVARAPTGREVGARHVARLEARGDWILAHLDGERVLGFRRSSVPARGQVGLAVGETSVRVHSVRLIPMKPLDSREKHELRSRPIVIAHRGFSSRAPENTLAAYRLAIEIGAELAECDVRLSSDRVPVLIHDDDLKRTAGVDRKVAELTAAELGALDAGRWKDEAFAGEPIPTLEQALRLVHGKLRLVIEIKDTGMEREVVDAIRAAGVDPIDLMIFSFDHATVKTIAEIEPLLPTAWLIADPPTGLDDRREIIRDALRIRASGIGFARDQVYPDFVRLAHECGFTVFVWTVNDPGEMRALVEAGVDAIISDRPDVLMGVVGAQ